MTTKNEFYRQINQVVINAVDLGLINKQVVEKIAAKSKKCFKSLVKNVFDGEKPQFLASYLTNERIFAFLKKDSQLVIVCFCEFNGEKEPHEPIFTCDEISNAVGSFACLLENEPGIGTFGGFETELVQLYLTDECAYFENVHTDALAKQAVEDIVDELLKELRDE